MFVTATSHDDYGILGTPTECTSVTDIFVKMRIKMMCAHLEGDAAFGLDFIDTNADGDPYHTSLSFGMKHKTII